MRSGFLSFLCRYHRQQPTPRNTEAARPRPTIQGAFQLCRSYSYIVVIVIEPSGSLGGGPFGNEEIKSATRAMQIKPSMNICKGERLEIIYDRAALEPNIKAHWRRATGFRLQSR